MMAHALEPIDDLQSMIILIKAVLYNTPFILTVNPSDRSSLQAPCISFEI
jgi:hypothetical protein